MDEMQPNPDGQRRKTRSLGLLAGLGVSATVHYYKSLALAAEQRGVVLDMVMVHAQTPRVFEYVAASDRDGLAAYLNGFILRLQAAGCEIAVIPAVTPHYAAHELTALSPLPLLNIFGPLTHELTAEGVRKISVFGSEPVMRSGLFGQLGNVEVISPEPDEITAVHAIYLELLATGVGTQQQYRELNALAHRILKRDQVDAIVLAGTDLSLVFNDSNIDFPCFDCARLHVRAIEDVLFA
jgi:aspartate racemase